MGLPTKKQKKKHSRGTRKALETLDILNSEDQSLIDTPKKSKKSESKKAVTKKTLDMAEKLEPKPPETSTPDEEQRLANAVEENEAMQQAEVIVVNETKNNEMSIVAEVAVQEINSQLVEIESKKSKGKAPSDNRSKIVTADALDGEDEDTQLDKYLTFCIGKTDYGIEIKFITEIIVIQKITSVPDTVQFIKGVINLRGKVIPVMDVRERLGMEARNYDDRTCIIVVNYDEVFVGLIVDTVNEVVDIPASDIDASPSIHSGGQSDYIAGMGRIDESVKLILNLQNVLDIGEHVFHPDNESMSQTPTVI